MPIFAATVISRLSLENIEERFLSCAPFEDQVGERKVDRQQTRCQRHRAVGLDLAIGEVGEPVAVSGDQAPAGRAQSGVEAEENHSRSPVP